MFRNDTHMLCLMLDHEKARTESILEKLKRCEPLSVEESHELSFTLEFLFGEFLDDVRTVNQTAHSKRIIITSLM